MSVAALQLSNPSLPNRVHVFISLRSKRFRAVSEQRTMNESQRLQKTENPVPRSFFAPKPHGNACYIGYVFISLDQFEHLLVVTGL